ncbi:MAG TPA: DegT/DnrJ/EryC1/StrS family aminotransferase [Vicinamibacterales bacterium]|nr:DegT/DnrJ/EryC1/StrS family aminotransferase [Vicinamibacterales bacterium]
MIPYLDLQAQYRSIKGEIDSAVLRVLDSTQYILGEEVAAFEREFAGYCQASQAIGVNSGTSALHLALLAAGIGPGDEVITVPFTFVATVSAICYTGATPVFVDIEPDYFTMDPSKVEAAITPKTKAIMPVHLYGQPADMDPIAEIARRRGLVVIEDAAQAHGSEYHGRRCGSIAEIAGFSFYPGKNLGAYGEGGAVTTTRADWAATCRTLRDWGQEKRYEHRLKGFNYRMDGIQGAILRVKLRHLEAWTERRRQVAEWYAAALDPDTVRMPKARPGCRHVYHVYVVRADDRDRLRDVLGRQGIQTGIHYPIPIHLQPAHADLGYHAGDFPVAEQVAREVLSLPIFPEMTRDQVQTVAAAVMGARV